jgi:hypothetical protein
MNVIKINAKDIYENDNNGFIYGLEGIGEYKEYIEWFKTEQERNNTIDLNNFEVKD